MLTVEKIFYILVYLFALRPTVTLSITAVIQGLREDFAVSRNPSSLGETFQSITLSTPTTHSSGNSPH